LLSDLEPIRIPESQTPKVVPVRLDDSNVAIFIGRKHTVYSKESAVWEFDDSGAAVLDDVVVGNDAAIFAYEEATALGKRMTVLIRHDD
jgi:hypothetical protein